MGDMSFAPVSGRTAALARGVIVLARATDVASPRKATSQIRLSSKLHARLLAFRKVAAAIVGKPITARQALEIIVHRGLDAALWDILGAQEKETLVASMNKLSAKYPVEFYGFLAASLGRGADLQRRSARRRLIGFSAGKQSD
jgi:hypothetical protein